MKNIKFTSGKITKLDDLYFNMDLFNGDKRVYSATLDLDDFMKITSKHRNITIDLNN